MKRFLLAASLSASALAAEKPDVILDNTDGAGVTVEGSWVSAQDTRNVLFSEARPAATDQPPAPNQHFGVEYFHDRDAGKGMKRVEFAPELPGAGRYEIFAWWPVGPDRASRVPLTVRHAGGTTALEVDQRTRGAQWNSLGTFAIDTRGQAAVTVSNRGTDGLVVADAVRFSPRGEITAFPAQSPPPEARIAVGTQTQLFVDDFVVATAKGVSRIYGHPEKVNDGKPIMTATKPWEDPATFGILADVNFDPATERFRMWYWPRRFLHGYAESVDGRTWTKPDLGLVPWEGSLANNLVQADTGKHLGVYFDPHETDPAHRFKAVGDTEKVSQSRLLYSADGFHWHNYHDGKPVTYRAADFTNQIRWDPAKGTYLLITRTDYGTEGGKEEIRGVRTMINPDPKGDPAGWRTAKSWFLDQPGDAPSRRQVYFLVDNLHEGVHFGFAAVYEWIQDLSEGEKPDYRRRHERDILNSYLLLSRDGITWDVSSIYRQEPLIERGPDGAFDKDIVMPAAIVTRGDQHYIYYGGWDERHEITSRHGNHRGIGLAMLPLNRFSGFEAQERGTVVTKSFVLSDGTLEINADTRRGTLTVEICDEQNAPIPGFAATVTNVDGVQLAVQWSRGASLSSLAGRIVRLRFQLERSRLFAFGIRASGR